MPAPESVSTMVGGAFLLDDLDLLRAGVPVFDDLDAPVLMNAPGTATDVVVLEPEGVPIALVRCTGDGSSTDRRVVRVERWLEPRPQRPFEELHLSVAATPVTECTVVVDDGVDAARIASEMRAHDSSTALLLLPVALERDGQSDQLMVDRARVLHQKVAELPVELQERVHLVLVPIADDHPYRERRLHACATAYAHGGEVIDLRTARAREQAGRGGVVVLFTGLSGSGKSTVARALRNRLLERTDRAVTLLDGDVVRRHLSAGLGFGAVDRDTNIRRIGWVAARIAEHGGLAIASPIAPYAATREDVAAMTHAVGGRFVLIHVSTPLAECERRDRKGLYARARRGEIADFTGISAPYEEPVDPDLRLDTTDSDVAELTQQIIDLGVDRGLWGQPLDSRL
ncbi:MAG: adenylyl-sulfate kinase [Ornithinimicrobium sp.]